MAIQLNKKVVNMKLTSFLYLDTEEKRDGERSKSIGETENFQELSNALLFNDAIKKTLTALLN